MKNEMKLNEALEKLWRAGYLVEGQGYSNTYYADGTRKKTRYGNDTGDAGYTYTKPTKNRKYIQILQCLLDGDKTKAEVHAELGLPDPTVVKNQFGHANNYYTSVWQELRRAGLADFTRVDGRVVWFITPRGEELVDIANSAT